MTKDVGNTGFGPAELRVAGDMGILVEFGEIYHPVINNAVIAFDAELQKNLPTGVIETVPSFRSILVRFDPFKLPFDALWQQLRSRLDAQNWYAAPPPRSRNRWVLPVVYGGARGPHLGEVADFIGLREDQVADHHAAEALTVAMLGFSPGLAYLGQLPERWQIARRSELTPRVPAGAVLVAVRQTVLPSTEIPTGWHQIGQTPFRGFDASASPPFLIAPGDEVRFEPVSERDYAGFDMDHQRRKGAR